MKLFCLVLIFSCFAAGCGKINTQAQISAPNTNASNNKASKTGVVVQSNVDKSKPNTFDITTIDFKNFSFPDFSPGTPEKTFTLKNAVTENKQGFPKYTLRKTYYFDLTGDQQNEAISHVIADGCQMGCDSSNLFYIYTAESDKPKLLWKVATGGNVLGGLKAAIFKEKEIVFEVFGECAINNSVISPNIDSKKYNSLKTNSYTRFVFSRTENGFTQTAKDVLPLPSNTSVAGYRSQIIFGEEL